MKHLKIKLFFILLITTSITFSQENTKKDEITTLSKIFKGFSMSGDWFIANQSKKVGNGNWKNAFIVKRSYFTLKKEINDIFSVRYTQDITLDKEGDDRGNVETRMKYLYLKIKPKWTGKITGSFFEIGMVHRPWITYEQKINPYRVQGNMHVERNKLYNSAGFGILFGGNIGAKMDKKYLKEVNGSMKGKYASFQIGIYNGGGYAKFEENDNKVIEGLLQFRPFANSVPQIQISHAFNIGKGNTSASPDFKQFLFHGGYMGKAFNAGAQYHFGVGDFQGAMVDANGKALKNNGFSLFSEYKFNNSPWAVFARFDKFTLKDDGKREIERTIGGIKYKLYKGISLILTGEADKTHTKDIYLVDLNMQISF